MNTGWIKLHRSIVDWGWYRDTNTRSVFIHLLLTANNEDKTWRDIVIHKGQTIIGRKALALKLGMTERTVRTAITHLISTNEITIKATNKFSLVTIVKWADYQGGATIKATSRKTNNRPTTDQQPTTPKEYKNIRNKEEIYVEVINFFNETFGKQTKSYATWQENCDFHLKTYSVADIKQAIANWKRYGWWAKEPSLELLFRTKNKSGPCDYIDQLLNLQDAVKGSKDPLAGLVKKGAYVSG